MLNFRPAEGYPIDSYYLMDFSHSMHDDLENLKLLAGNLTEEFKLVSEDFTIGMLRVRLRIRQMACIVFLVYTIQRECHIILMIIY